MKNILYKKKKITPKASCCWKEQVDGNMRISGVYEPTCLVHFIYILFAMQWYLYPEDKQQKFIIFFNINKF